MRYDYVIVGAGFSGAVLAERLAAIGKNVLVIDKRGHIGGNCYDYYDSHGVLVHRYGPHYFRTDHDDVKEYLSRFTEWIPHEYIVKASVDGKLYPFPINRKTLNLFFGVDLKDEEEAERFLEKKRVDCDTPKNAEEQVLAIAGIELYEAFFKNYTIKQWGIDPKDLDASVTARIPIRTNTDDRYLRESFQAMPKEGYTKLFERMLKGIPVLLNTTWDDIKDSIRYERLIYTGQIDSFFSHAHGKLPYRSLRFIFENHKKEYYQEVSQVNYPNEHEWTRIVEIKHATHQDCKTTTIVKEIPCAGGEPFYPMPMKESAALYARYADDAARLENTYITGRLGLYRYLNMDQVVKKALDLFLEIEP